MRLIGWTNRVGSDLYLSHNHFRPAIIMVDEMCKVPIRLYQLKQSFRRQYYHYTDDVVRPPGSEGKVIILFGNIQFLTAVSTEIPSGQRFRSRESETYTATSRRLNDNVVCSMTERPWEINNLNNKMVVQNCRGNLVNFVRVKKLYAHNWAFYQSGFCRLRLLALKYKIMILRIFQWFF